MAMRRRRRQDSWDVLVILPWWISVLLFLITYLGCKFLVPQIQPASPLFLPILQAVSVYAHFFAAPFLLTALLSLLRKVDEEARF